MKHDIIPFQDKSVENLLLYSSLNVRLDYDADGRLADETITNYR